MSTPSLPGYRPYRCVVSEVRRLSSDFVRIAFHADDFATFGTCGFDQRIKILFPVSSRPVDVGTDRTDELVSGEWHRLWRGLADEIRPVIRTYTVRSVDTVARQVYVDFADHGPEGPGGRWLSTATIGDEVILVGPDARSPDSDEGIDYHPGDASTVLLVGDETAAPAILAILDRLPAERNVHAIIEVPDEGYGSATPVNSAITWLSRRSNGIAAGDVGALLVPAVTAFGRDRLMNSASTAVVQTLPDIDIDSDMLWEVPTESSSETYAWIGGEAGAVKTLRRILVNEFGMDRKAVAFMGYWRAGRSEN